MNALASLFLGLAFPASTAPVSVARPLHTQVVVVTESGTPGDRTLVRTGHFAGEENFSIDGNGCLVRRCVRTVPPLPGHSF